MSSDDDIKQSEKYKLFMTAFTKLKDTLLCPEFTALGSVQAVIIMLREFANELEYLDSKLRRLQDAATELLPSDAKKPTENN